MPSITQIVEDRQLLTVMHQYLTTYQQVAAAQMERYRDGIVHGRSYAVGLSQVYADVRASYRRRQLEQAAKKATKQRVKQAAPQPGFAHRSAVVFFSPETKFSTAINRSILEHFVEYVDKKNPSRVFVVGRIAQGLVKASRPELNFESFHLPDRLGEIADIQPLLEALVPFEEVEVFYGQFLSLVKQIPQQTSLSDQATADMFSTQTTKLTTTEFLFEPDLTAMVAFFQTQIFTLLLLRSHQESHLANLGARITTLDQAREGVRRQQKIFEQTERKLRRHLKNRKQRQQPAGSALW